MEVWLQRDYLAKTMKTSDQNKDVIERVFFYPVPAFHLQINLMKYFCEILVDRYSLAFFLTKNIVRPFISV